MMLDLNTCLQDIVGLSENDCGCYGTDEPVLGGIDGDDVLAPIEGNPEASIDRPVDWNKSLSGLYLDDQKYSVPLKFTASTKDCGDGNVWDVLLRSRRKGYHNFVTDLGAQVLDSYHGRMQKWLGNTAGTAHNYTISNLSALAGVYIEPVQWRGVKGIINEVELYVQGSGTYQVNVYAESDLNMPINENPIEVNVVNHFGRTKLDTPLTLSFSDAYSRKVGYYLVYDLQGAEPRNLQFSCNCGRDLPWINHFKIYGVSAGTAADLEAAGRNTQYPYGVRLNFSVACGMDWLCRQWDFSRPWDRVAAECMMLYGIAELLERQLNDPQPVTTANPELVMEKLKMNRSILGKRMPWLANNIPFEESDCYVCKTTHTVQEMLI